MIENASHEQLIAWKRLLEIKKRRIKNDKRDIKTNTNYI